MGKVGTHNSSSDVSESSLLAFVGGSCTGCDLVVATVFLSVENGNSLGGGGGVGLLDWDRRPSPGPLSSTFPFPEAVLGSGPVSGLAFSSSSSVASWSERGGVSFSKSDSGSGAGFFADSEFPDSVSVVCGDFRLALRFAALEACGDLDFCDCRASRICAAVQN